MADFLAGSRSSCAIFCQDCVHEWFEHSLGSDYGDPDNIVSVFRVIQDNDAWGDFFTVPDALARLYKYGVPVGSIPNGGFRQRFQILAFYCWISHGLPP